MIQTGANRDRTKTLMVYLRNNEEFHTKTRLEHLKAELVQVILLQVKIYNEKGWFG